MKWTRHEDGKRTADGVIIQRVEVVRPTHRYTTWQARVVLPDRIEYIEYQRLTSAKRAAEKLLREERMRR